MTKLMLADADEEFLIDLQGHVTRQNAAYQVEIVTDPAYLCRCLQSGEGVDLLVISENLYAAVLRCDAKALEAVPRRRIVLLSESCKTAEAGAAHLRIPRGRPEVLLAVTAKLFPKKAERVVPKTKLIAVYSPLGRCGKTTVAMGLAHKLSLLGQRTLFLSLDRLQSFNWLLSESMYLPDEALSIFSAENESIVSDLARVTRRHGFSYVPPFYAPACSLQVSPKVYLVLAKRLIEAERYDAVVLDLSCGFSTSVAELLKMAHHTVLLTLQDANSAYKLNRQLLCLEDPFSEAFSYVCNLFQPEAPNQLSVHIRQKIGELVIPYCAQLDGESLWTAENNEAFARVMEGLSAQILR